MNPVGRIAGVLGLAAVAVGTAATPASAHVGSGPSPSNWRSEVTSVSPPMPGVSVRTVDNGDLVELVNRSDVTVTVLGYDGEPYLRIGRAGGVEQNTRSAATYLNRTRDGRTEPPPQARDPQAVPDWQPVAREARYRWHDHRIHWMRAEPPPAVRANPSRAQDVSHWTLRFRYGTTPVTVSGTLSWVPPPSPWPWYGLAFGLAALAGAVGWLPASRPPAPGGAGGGRTGRRVAVPVALAVALLVALLLAADVTHAAGEGLSWGSVVDVPAWAAGGLAVVLAIRRSRYTPLVAGLVGAVTAVVDGLGDLGTLRHSQLPFTGPDWLARGCVATALGLGAGLVVAAWRLSRPPALIPAEADGDRPEAPPGPRTTGAATGTAGAGVAGQAGAAPEVAEGRVAGAGAADPGGVTDRGVGG